MLLFFGHNHNSFLTATTDNSLHLQKRVQGPYNNILPIRELPVCSLQVHSLWQLLLLSHYFGQLGQNYSVVLKYWLVCALFWPTLDNSYIREEENKFKKIWKSYLWHFTTKNWVILVTDAHYCVLTLLQTTKYDPGGVCYKESWL